MLLVFGYLSFHDIKTVTMICKEWRVYGEVKLKTFKTSINIPYTNSSYFGTNPFRYEDQFRILMSSERKFTSIKMSPGETFTMRRLTQFVHKNIENLETLKIRSTANNVLVRFLSSIQDGRKINEISLDMSFVQPGNCLFQTLNTLLVGPFSLKKLKLNFSHGRPFESFSKKNFNLCNHIEDLEIQCQYGNCISLTYFTKYLSGIRTLTIFRLTRCSSFELLFVCSSLKQFNTNLNKLVIGISHNLPSLQLNSLKIIHIRILSHYIDCLPFLMANPQLDEVKIDFYRFHSKKSLFRLLDLCSFKELHLHGLHIHIKKVHFHLVNSEIPKRIRNIKLSHTGLCLNMNVWSKMSEYPLK